MKALTFHGKRDVRVDEVPDPSIQDPTDAIVRITSTAICGSDLHLYEVLGMFIDEGDILGHEPMGIVEESTSCPPPGRRSTTRRSPTAARSPSSASARSDRWRPIDGDEHDDVSAAIRELTDGPIAAKLTEKAAVDRLSALLDAIDTVRRGGTVSISGVYGGQLDPLPMMKMFDKGLQIRMGQAHVKQWTEEILPLLEGDDDPLGVDDLTTHQLPLGDGPSAYEMFQKKDDGAIKVVLKP